MILVDSSVWIDFLRANETPQTTLLKSAFGRQRILTIDLVIMEVLQGTRNDREFAFVRDRLFRMVVLPSNDIDLTVLTAQHYHLLRGKGITIRKTIDTLIATRCIVDGVPLLYRDRDFDPFVEHLGLKSALAYFSGVN